MKQSKYNCILQDNTGMVIYNAATDQLVALTPQLANIFNESKAAPEKIKAQHAELYDHLLQKVYLCAMMPMKQKRIYVSVRNMSAAAESIP